jgi:hypothetical protein
MRQLHWMPPERVAEVIASVVEAPPDVALGLVEVLPENPQAGPL